MPQSFEGPTPEEVVPGYSKMIGRTVNKDGTYAEVWEQTTGDLVAVKGIVLDDGERGMPLEEVLKIPSTPEAEVKFLAAKMHEEQ